MLISPAFATEATNAAIPAAESTGGVLMQFMPLFLIFAVFYFLLIRPQQKKLREHQNMLDALRRGDKVMTVGGILATITKIETDGEIVLEIAKGVEVRSTKAGIASVIARTEPVKGEDGKAA